MERDSNVLHEVNSYLNKLFSITRSLSGRGNRETIQILQEIIPLNTYEIKSGTKVYDWTIPNEWNINEAWIKNSKGEILVDFRKNNLHVVNYSIPFSGTLSFLELQKHLYYFKEQPDAIPYRTSYYKEAWGFCISYNDYLKKFHPQEKYEVFIDSTLLPGSLTYADYVIKGKSDKEYLISTYICHPSMANDNLSGILLTTFLAKELQKLSLQFTYRFVFVPETIGAIAYCHENEKQMGKILGGFVVTCVAGTGQIGYKRTFIGNHLIDRVVKGVLADKNISFIEYPFEPQGSDERQYSSPGFRIPIGLITKDKFHEYDFYHTSLDNLDFVNAENLLYTLDIYLDVIKRVDSCHYFRSNFPNCEPQLGKRGLYPTIGRRTLSSEKHIGDTSNEMMLSALLWLLFYADNKHNLQDIVEKSFLPFNLLMEGMETLKKNNLITYTNI